MELPDLEPSCRRRKAVRASWAAFRGSTAGPVVAAPEAPRTASSIGLLTAAALKELQELLEGPRGARDAPRCMELCRPLHFFRRLADDQGAALLNKCELLILPAGQFVYQEGDPLGCLYVILAGSITVQQPGDLLGGKAPFLHSVFDGKAFGDNWDCAETGSSAAKGYRTSNAIAQEDTSLLRISTADYQASLALACKGPGADLGPELLRELPFLAACGEYELQVLAMLLEPKVVHYGDYVVKPGDHPEACYILAQGLCKLRLPGTEGAGGPANGLAVRDLARGACFAVGALSDPLGVCNYAAQAAVVVESTTAEFHLLSRRSLFMLPEVIQERIQEQLKEAEKDDAILENGSDVQAAERAWRRQKRRLLAELRRCSERPERFGHASGLPKVSPWLPPGPNCTARPPVRPGGRRPASAAPASQRKSAESTQLPRSKLALLLDAWAKAPEGVSGLLPTTFSQDTSELASTL